MFAQARSRMASPYSRMAAWAPSSPVSRTCRSSGRIRRSVYRCRITTSSPSTRTLSDAPSSSSSSSPGANRSRAKCRCSNSCASASRPTRSRAKTSRYFSFTCSRVVSLGAPKRSRMTLKTTLKAGRVKTIITSPGIPSAGSKRASGWESCALSSRYSSVLPCRCRPMEVYSSCTGLAGISERRKATVSHGRSVSAWKYERAKEKTRCTSSRSVSTASGRTPSGRCSSGISSGTSSPDSGRRRATRYAALLR